MRARVAEFFVRELGALKTKHALLEKEHSLLQNDTFKLAAERSKLAADIKELERSLTRMTLVRDLAVAKGENVEAESTNLQDYILVNHEEGFNQVIRKATFLYSITDDESRFILKDVYKGELIPVDDVPATDYAKDVVDH